MVRRVLNVEHERLVVDLLGDTARLPWVKLAVREDYVGGLGEVTLGVPTSEVVQSPVVLRQLPVRSIAIGAVFLLVPAGGREHGGGGVRGEWHGHLVASLDGPAVVVKTTALLDGDIQTVKLAGIVVESGTSGLDGVKGLVGVALSGLVG